MNARKAAAVFAIVGTDSYLAEEALERVLDAAVGKDRSDSVQLLRGDETTWPRVLDAARMRSLFAPRRAVVVRGAEALKGPEDDLASYLEDPTPGVTLILLAAKPDKRRMAWKKVLDKAERIAVEPLKGQRLSARIHEELRRRQLALDADGVQELTERVGQDLRRLMGELDKLEAFARGQKRISAEDVAAVLGRGMARPFYLLADAFAERDAAKALELVSALLEDGEEAPLIVGALYRQVRQLRAVKALREARASREETLARLKLPPNLAFKLPSLQQAAARWSELELTAALRVLGKADRRVKTGTAASVTLSAALLEACRKQGGEATNARPGR
jgi:DNA polymerase-3 subunit delta